LNNCGSGESGSTRVESGSVRVGSDWESSRFRVTGYKANKGTNSPEQFQFLKC